MTEKERERDAMKEVINNSLTAYGYTEKNPRKNTSFFLSLFFILFPHVS